MASVHWEKANFEKKTKKKERSPPDRRFEFHKRGQLFIRMHNETLSITMRISNPDCSPVGINC
jgi:hypothetical protein